MSTPVAAARGSTFSTSRDAPVPRVTMRRSSAAAVAVALGPKGDAMSEVSDCAPVPRSTLRSRTPTARSRAKIARSQRQPPVACQTAPPTT